MMSSIADHYPIWYNWTLDGDWLPVTASNASALQLGPLNRTHFMKNLCCVVSSTSSLRPTSICAQLLVNRKKIYSLNICSCSKHLGKTNYVT